jgi:hypothetical protein
MDVGANCVRPLLTGECNSPLTITPSPQGDRKGRPYKLKLVFSSQASCYALAFAHITLNTKVKGEG